MTNKSLFERPEFSPRSLLRAAWKHKWLALSIAAIVAASGITVIYRLPAVYKADALILVDPQKIPERFVVSTVTQDAQDRLATISQEILSSTRLQKIIDDFHLYPNERKTHVPEEIIEIMRKDIDINLEKGLGGSRPGAFRITYQGPNPTVVAQVVNRITDLYIEENLRSREGRAEGTADFIDNELREAKQKLDQEDAAMSRYKVEHNGELPEQESSLIAMTTQLQMELQANQDATNRAQQNKIMLEASLSTAESMETNLKQPAAVDAGSNGGNDTAPLLSTLEKYQAEVSDLQNQLATLRLRYSDEHPDVKRLRTRLANAQRLEQQEEARRPAIAAQVPHATDPALNSRTAEIAQAHQRVNSLKSQIAATDRELKTRAADHDRILNSLNSYQRRIEQMPVREQEMAALRRDYDFSKTYYTSLLSKRAEADMATDLEKRQKAETFRVLDPARPPEKPFKPRRLLLSGVSVMVGLVLGLAFTIGMEVKRGVLLGEWELPAGTAVLGRVPYIVPSLEAVSHPDEFTQGKKERASLAHRLALLSSAMVLLLGVMAVAYFLIWNRI